VVSTGEFSEVMGDSTVSDVGDFKEGHGYLHFVESGRSIIGGGSSFVLK
jgi:hypothetical protein